MREFLVRILGLHHARNSRIRLPAPIKRKKKRVVIPSSVAMLERAIRYHVLGEELKPPYPPPVFVVVAPPGSGKRTVIEELVARAQEEDGEIGYEYITPDRVVSMWYGESTRLVAGSIDAIRRGVIVFDDVERLFPHGSKLRYEHEETGRMKAALSAKLSKLLDEEKPGKVVVFLANTESVDPMLKSRAYILKMTYTDDEMIEITKILLERNRVKHVDAEEIYRIVKRAVLELDYQYVVPRDIETVLMHALRFANERGREVTLDDIKRFARRAKDYLEEEYTSVVQVIRPDIKLSDVGGMHGVKERVVKIVRYALAGGNVPRGILLYGPPGVGKTYLAKAIAAETNATFLYVRVRDIISQHDPVEAINRVFRTARRYAPSIIFIDEFDSIATRRDINPNPVLGAVVNQLLTELEGLTSNNRGVVLITATNFIEKIDPAIISRFQPNVFNVAPPRTLEEYREVVEVYIRQYRASFSADDVLDVLLARFRTPRAIARLFEEADRLRGFEVYAYRTNDPVFSEDLERFWDIVRRYCGGSPEKCLGEGYPLRREHLELAIRNVPSETEKILEFYKRYIGNGKRIGFALGVAVLGAGTGVEEGAVFPILVQRSEGNGNIIVIGGDDTVRDSATAALAWLTSKYSEAKRYDWYVHFVTPLEGAVDPATGRKLGVSGPSAGVAIATAMYSSLTGTPVPSDTAFSGKISVHGDVGEVGGWDPRSSGKAFAVLVARNAGLRRVVVPRVLARDNPVLDMLRRHVDVVLAETMNDILKLVEEA